jgi:hypothetical protein
LNDAVSDLRVICPGSDCRVGDDEKQAADDKNNDGCSGNILILFGHNFLLKMKFEDSFV